MRRLAWLAVAVLALVAAAGLTGCGGGSGEEAATSPETRTTTQTQGTTAVGGTTAAEPQAPAGESVTVAVGDSAFGPILVYGEGRTLYLYSEDRGGEIACLDEPAAYAPGDTSIFPCSDPWPPLLTEGEPKAEEGVDASLLGTIGRPEGVAQVTYGGHPLYRSAFDSGPGSTFGKGAWGQWFLVTVEGDPVTVTTEG